MANHAPVDYIQISPNRGNTIKGVRYYNRLADVTRITPHHAAGVLSVKNMLDWFSKESTQASCTYVVGNDGKRGLCCEENVRPWTSSSKDNDNSAITVEVVNSATGGKWPVSDAAFDSLVDLCIDVCKRYGKKRLLWIPDKDTALAYKLKADEMLLTQHRWFANTNCPGEYLGSKFPELAARVTAALQGDEIDMTKDEVIKLIDKRIDEKLKGENTKPSGWAEKELAEAVALGITDGERPQGYATRQETAIMVKRGMKKEGA